MEELILREIAVLFLLSIVVVLVCHRFRLPSIVGFLLTGVLCGPSALGLIPNKEVVDIMLEQAASLRPQKDVREDFQNWLAPRLGGSASALEKLKNSMLKD